MRLTGSTRLKNRLTILGCYFYHMSANSDLLLSLSTLTGQLNFTSKNFGGVFTKSFLPLVIELLIIACCDKAIKIKQKWLSKQIVLTATAKRLSMKNVKERDVVSETIDGETLIKIGRNKDLEKDFLDLEKEMFMKTSVLSHMLWKHDLMRSLPQKYTYHLRPDEDLNFEHVSFTLIKSSILSYFSSRKGTLSVKSGFKSIEVAAPSSMVGALGTMKKSQVSHLGRKPEPRIGIHDQAKKAMKMSQLVSGKKISQRTITAMEQSQPSPLVHYDYEFEEEEEENDTSSLVVLSRDGPFVKTIAALSSDIKDSISVDNEDFPKSRRSSIVKGDNAAPAF
jgi:hypothetical protein